MSVQRKEDLLIKENFDAIMTESQSTEYKESWRDEYRNTCRDEGYPTPRFRYDGGLWVEFTFPKASGKTRVEAPAEMSGKMSGKIAVLIQEKPDITIPEMAQQLDRTERTIERLINQLKADEVVRRIGPAKGGYWEIIKK